MLSSNRRTLPRIRLRAPLMLTPSGFLFNEEDGESYSLNRTGLCIMKVLLAGRTLADALRAVVDEFDVPERRARRDILLFIAHLKALRLVDELEPREHA